MWWKIIFHHIPKRKLDIMTQQEKFTYLDNVVDKSEAEKYINRRFSSKRMQKVNKDEIAFAKYVASLPHNSSLVDIPCGSGRFTTTFEMIGTLYGFDYNPHMVEEAKKNNAHKNATFDVGDIKQIPLDDGAVDIVFSMRLLHHVDNDETRQKIINELVRVAKHWVAFSFYRSDSWKYWRKKIRGKNIAGFPIPTKHLLKLAKDSNLTLHKLIKISGYQTLVIFEKSGSQ